LRKLTKARNTCQGTKPSRCNFSQGQQQSVKHPKQGDRPRNKMTTAAHEVLLARATGLSDAALLHECRIHSLAITYLILWLLYVQNVASHIYTAASRGGAECGGIAAGST
jgi:hypothetical protein